MKNEHDSTLLVSLGSCNFGRLYSDASLLMDAAEAGVLSEYESKSCLPRTALLLFAVSLEALANRVIRDIEELTGETRISERASTSDKWKQLPKSHPHGKGGFDTNADYWHCFKELIKWRDEYVHPKAVVPEVQRGRRNADGSFKAISVFSPSEIPPAVRQRIPELKGPLIHGHSRLPSSPYAIAFEDAKKGQNIVDDMKRRLDIKLNGRLTSAHLLVETDRAYRVEPNGDVHLVFTRRAAKLPVVS